MEIKFRNGAVVNRMWGSNPEGELLAAFQYSGCAIEYAKAKLADDASRGFYESHYVVCSTQDGRISAFHHSPKDGAAAK
jgi:hypothetical protein